MSPPSRGRGLKLFLLIYILVHGLVAPFAGAWIETVRIPLTAQPLGVAPFAGAWIETLETHLFHPSYGVALFAGAWIETCLFIGKRRNILHGYVYWIIISYGEILSVIVGNKGGF